jgi:predicted permease
MPQRLPSFSIEKMGLPAPLFVFTASPYATMHVFIFTCKEGSMGTLFTALSPIFALIFIGYGLKRMRFPAEGFWPLLDKLTYYVLIPAMLVHKLSTVTLESSTSAIIMVKIVLLALLLLSAILMLIQHVMKFSGPVYSSIFQGAIRYNTYVYLALIDALYGDSGIVLAAFLITFVIPFINVLSVSTFGIYVSEGRFSFKNLTKSVISNPLILACLLGGFLNFSTIGLPFVFEPILKMLGAPGIPLGLLSIGVGLRFRSLGTFSPDFWVSSVAKLVIFPLMVWAACEIGDVEGMMRNVLILFAAMPTAAAAYILARQMGGDVALMSTLITGQTLLAFGTLSIVLTFVL